MHFLKSGSSCEVHNVKSDGDGESYEEKTDWQECAEYCRQNTSCTHWNYMTSNQRCYLKSGGFIKADQNNNYYITGYRECTPGKACLKDLSKLIRKPQHNSTINST